MALKTTITLAATRRDETGKGVARQLRMNGRIPAVIYGRGRKSEALTVSAMDYDKAITGQSGSSIIDLEVDGKTVKALIRDVQRHPVRPGIMHVDFYEIHEGVAITVNVPIHLIGVPDGVKSHGGTLDQILREIQIEVLPRHIPENIEIDVSELGIGDSVHVRDITAEHMKLLADVDATVCTVAAPRVEEEVVPEGEEEDLVEGAEPEVIGRETDEGDAPAEASGAS